MSYCHAAPDAVAQIRGGPQAPYLKGQVRFYQERRGVLVVADICGLPQNNPTGFFAMHIHDGAGCAGEAFEETGAHFDPDGAPHPEHAGDLPPLMLNCGGAYMAVRTGRFKVWDVIGKTVVIHGGFDDFNSQPAGNAGEKIACGVICRVRHVC